MSNLPIVYSTADRHALLMDLAKKVQDQVDKHPTHDEAAAETYEEILRSHSVLHSK